MHHKLNILFIVVTIATLPVSPVNAQGCLPAAPGLPNDVIVLMDAPCQHPNHIS